MSKYTIRVATKDQYCYIEELYEGEYPQIRYKELYDVMNSSQKVSDTQFLTDLMNIVDHNLKVEGEGATEWHESLTDTQKKVLSKIRLLVNRAISKYKPEK